MYNFNDEIQEFYIDKVELPGSQRTKMRERRNINRDRTDNGLLSKYYPKKLMNLIQGSYKMKTMIQRDNNDYDIDDGIVFSRNSLKLNNGIDLSPLNARKMVHDAITVFSWQFNRKPECLKNCIRVYYNEGYHIDVPVYREYNDLFGNKVLELASTTWRKSDPRLIAEWFETNVQCKSPYSDNIQMRKIVCLLKKWACSRSSWNLPNGLIFSVLCDESYPQTNRLDEAFIKVLYYINDRLKYNTSVINPVDRNEDFTEGRETKMGNLKKALNEHFIPLFNVLTNYNCKRSDAMHALDKFFNTNYFTYL